MDQYDLPVRWVQFDRDRMDTPSLDRFRTEMLSTAPPRRRSIQTAATISIAVCTRNRPKQLLTCLSRIADATHGTAEIVVVDNAPQTDATRSVVDRLIEGGCDIRRVDEPRPGLSRARNAALKACHGDYVLFTDDDVLVDRNWVAATRTGLGRSAEVAVVTGLVPAAELESVPQLQFDSRLAWGSRLSPEVFSLGCTAAHSFIFPYSAGHFGTGANMAVHRRMVLDAGGFNEQLGAGTRSRGGEDLEMFVRMLRRGGTLVYEPSSIAWHVHRSDHADLRAQMFGYGSGFSAYLTALMEQPGRRDVLTAVLRGSLRLASAKSSESAAGTPSSLLWRELIGMAWGPFAYGWERAGRNRAMSGRTGLTW